MYIQSTWYCSIFYIHSLSMGNSCAPMEREASSSYFCIYSLLDLFFSLQQPFIKVPILGMSVETRARFAIGVVTVAVDATAVHLD